MNEALKDLLDECLAYRKYGQDISPIHVEDMIKKVYEAGRKEQIHTNKMKMALLKWDNTLCNIVTEEVTGHYIIKTNKGEMIEVETFDVIIINE